MVASIICGRKKCHKYFKILLVFLVISIYFIILLRESFAAWELTKAKNSNNEQSRTSRKHHHHYHRKSISSLVRPLSLHGDTISWNKSNVPTTIQPTTLNPIYEYSEELNTAAEHDFNERRSRLWDICEKINFVDRYPPNAWEFFISPGHGIAWCNVFKAASSTWMYYFNILAGYNLRFLQRTKASPLELARKRFPRPSKNELSEALINSLSFLIVREPFERLLSAYRNKLEGYRNKYYRLLGEQIVRKYRKHGKKYSPGPTFKEFITFLIQNHKNNKHPDEHWSPIYTFCTPCSINYTLIAKVETFRRDTEYIIRQAGLETLLLNKLPEKKMKQISNRSSSQTRDLISQYFGQIDEDLLVQLLEIYGPDFELFGYNSTKYFSLVQPSKLHYLISSTTTTTTTKTTTTVSTSLISSAQSKYLSGNSL